MTKHKQTVPPPEALLEVMCKAASGEALLDLHVHALKLQAKDEDTKRWIPYIDRIERELTERRIEFPERA